MILCIYIAYTYNNAPNNALVTHKRILAESGIYIPYSTSTIKNRKQRVAPGANAGFNSSRHTSSLIDLYIFLPKNYPCGYIAEVFIFIYLLCLYKNFAEFLALYSTLY